MTVFRFLPNIWQKSDNRFLTSRQKVITKYYSFGVSW